LHRRATNVFIIFPVKTFIDVYACGSLLAKTAWSLAAMLTPQSCFTGHCYSETNIYSTVHVTMATWRTFYWTVYWQCVKKVPTCKKTKRNKKNSCHIHLRCRTNENHRQTKLSLHTEAYTTELPVKSYIDEQLLLVEALINKGFDWELCTPQCADSYLWFNYCFTAVK